jgi:hypothetical protein
MPRLASPCHTSRLPLDKTEARYATLVKALSGRPGVTSQAAGSRGFGSSGQLKVNNRIFAMLVRGALVVKLPRRRVDQLVDSQDGQRFDPRRDGRVMKEWVVISARSKLDWLTLAREAMRFTATSD